MAERETNTINPFQQGSRRFFSEILKQDFALPTQAIEVGNGLTKAKELKEKEGYSIMFLTTHPSKTDEPREYPIVWNTEEFEDSSIIVPIARDKQTLLVRAISASVGIDLYPITTQDVINRTDSEQKSLGRGNLSYYKRIKESIGNNSAPGVLFLAPDAGRRSSLNVPQTKAAELALTAAGEKTAVVFLGIEIHNIENYEEARGTNFGVDYTIRIGDAYTKSEIADILESYRAENNFSLDRFDRPFQHFEQWSYTTQFPDLVTKQYGGTA